jgi:hypothetical protein
MKEEIFTLTGKELFDLLVKAYNNGFNQYEMVEAGLEPKEAELSADWIITRLKIKN